MDRALIVSATNLLCRGWLVVPSDRKSPSGKPVNGLFAVARALDRAVAWKAPALGVAIIDPKACDGKPAALGEQLPELERLVSTLGFRVVFTDDEPSLVASYVRASRQAGHDVVIAGVDKRYAQLVTDHVWWYDANKDVRYTREIVEKRFNVPPPQVAEWLALVGDDGAMPGVAGIGAKGATTLLTTYGTVSNALSNVDAMDGRLRKVVKAAEGAIPAELARATLDQHRALPLPLEHAAFAPPSAGARNALHAELGFAELLVAEDNATAVRELEDVAELRSWLEGATATTTIHALIEDDGTLAGIALARADREVAYVPAKASAWSELAAWLDEPRHAKGGHDLGGTMVALARAGATLRGVTVDSACLSHLSQPSNWAPHDLQLVARHALGWALPGDDEVRGVGRQRKAWMELKHGRSAAVAGERALASSDVTAKLAPSVEPARLAEYLELTETLVRMELRGIGVDRAELDAAEVAFAEIERELELEIERLVGHAFNINSQKQLGAVLFEELGLPAPLHTKTGWSTSIEALERIEHAHAVVPLVLRWRRLRRLRDSWIIALRKDIDDTGRIHSSFHVARSFSGTLINTNPDLGRVPGRTPEMARIRRAFVPAPGHLLMSVDFNQLGLHVLAHLSKDPALVGPLSTRSDMHRLTAAAVLEKAPEDITYEERQTGKVVNFATFAGQGASALGMQLGLSPADAKSYIARFDRHYAGVRAFQDEQLRLVETQGFITTIAGRRWPIGGLDSLDPMLRSYAERLARRATHEGSVADVSRRALLDADRALRASGLRTQPLLQILDEVLFEVPEDEVEAAARCCCDAMRNAFALEVPLAVGLELGKNWADLEPYPPPASGRAASTS